MSSWVHVGLTQLEGFVFIVAASVEQHKQTSLCFQGRDVKLLYKDQKNNEITADRGKNKLRERLISTCNAQG